MDWVIVMTGITKVLQVGTNLDGCCKEPVKLGRFSFQNLDCNFD